MMRRMDRVLERMQDLDNRTKHLEPRILLGSPSTEAADSSPSSVRLAFYGRNCFLPLSIYISLSL